MFFKIEYYYIEYNLIVCVRYCIKYFVFIILSIIYRLEFVILIISLCVACFLEYGRFLVNICWVSKGIKKVNVNVVIVILVF